MRKTISILLIAMLVVLTAGCGPEEKSPDQEMEQLEQSDAIEEVGGEIVGDMQIQSETEAPGEADSPEDGSDDDDSGVVAKSSNAVSSEEKEAVLVELDKELSDLLDSINQLETVEDSDLEME